MRFLGTFIKNMLLIQAVGISGLLVAGFIMTLAEGDQNIGRTFFTYRIQRLDQLPFWFAALMLLTCLNGFWLFRLALIEGGFGTPQGPWGDYNVTVPINHLRLFAINLITIPALIALFIVIRCLNF